MSGENFLLQYTSAYGSTEWRQNIKGCPWVYCGHPWSFKKHFSKAHLAVSLGNLLLLRAWFWCSALCGLLVEQDFLNLTESLMCNCLMCKEGTEVAISLPPLSFNFEKPVITLCMILCISEVFSSVLPILLSLTAWLATWTFLWLHDNYLLKIKIK